METLADAELEGKNVVLRTDLNLPIEDGEPQTTVRFERYLETVEKLSEEGARTMIIAHQGRPARKDFTSLEKHSEHLSDALDRDVNFVQSFFGPELGDAVASMENGDVCLLENIRFLSEELQNVSPERHSQDYFVSNMARYFDAFVDDAFSAAHRSHASMVGFAPLLDSYAGPVMQRELESCRKVRDEMDNPLLVLGGEKPADLVGMMEQMIDRADKVLLAGVPGELALVLRGKELGGKNEWIEDQGFDSRSDELEKLLDEHGDKILLPEDVRTGSGSYDVSEVPDDEMVWDIGERTEQRFVEEIEKADSVLMKGPMGAFDEGHEEGTRAVVEAIASSDAFTVLGGGHTSSLVHRFGHSLDDFSHVSIAGGAFVRYMSGEELPAVDALENS
ncbi:MAG: phosphoglycerate kinase [Candidatus Nanohaloarchaea archaeon]